MLGKGRALSNQPYQAYMGPLTAGASGLQNQAFSGIAGLAVPTDMGGFTQQSFTDPGVADKYMNPYLQESLNPQIAEAQRQAELTRLQNNSRLTQAGAFGGSRQALMDSENQRNMLRNVADITGKGYDTAYNAGAGQFNTEQALGLDASQQNNQYGLAALQQQMNMGNAQRGIESEGIAADMNQFNEERDYPYKQVQFQQSLLQGLPLEAQSYSYAEPTGFNQLLGGAGGILSVLNTIPGGTDWLSKIFGGTP